MNGRSGGKAGMLPVVISRPGEIGDVRALVRHKVWQRHQQVQRPSPQQWQERSQCTKQLTDADVINQHGESEFI